ncbi:Predicted arabinose efflux permease, MFS family [Dyella sp. OK004]|uniref:MFS transporter n=1 Tax=Dyella sp. OK004 TaxID=1855292 RepID=UPI0008E568CA|nr:MFS transporter [Dyella sp. OK004]SFR94806.1 Predicted arabinose efflux permease, MFS family [Dyella sp. OK004]
MSANECVLADTSSTETSTPLPLWGLLALACAGFITVLTEAVPAGLLPAISADLGISQSLAGQLVTVYALGSIGAAIPLVKLTRTWSRRPLLLTAIAGFALVNGLTAWTHSYPLMLLTRALAGVSAGLLWALLAGYAGRIVAPHQQGRAMAVAMVGIPVALSLGIPAGTWLGQLLGWRWVFGSMSLLSLGVVAWARAALPPLPAQTEQAHARLRDVFALPGLSSVLLVMVLFVLAHNLLYTYIAPLASRAGAADVLDRVLLVFGVASLAGISLVGSLIDRWMRPLAWLTVVLFGVAALVLVAWPGSITALCVAAGIWGLAFGGSPTLFQTAVARRSGPQADLAQSLVVTGWNLSIAAGGFFGGWMLKASGEIALPWAAVALLVAGLWVAVPAKRAWAE